MFFFFGIMDDKKDLNVTQRLLCAVCGRTGNIQVVVTYTVLSIFFIPCFKWNRKYYVRFDCCNSIYQLDSEVGKRLERGEITEISASDLTLLQNGTAGAESGTKRCAHCGYETGEDFAYCPKCGNKL